MPYAEGRTYYDADSHVMEIDDWLPQYADPDVRDRIRPLYLGGAGKLASKAVADAAARRAQPSGTSYEGNVMEPKGWGALGAFDRDERSHALDLLGFHKQLVFPTFAAGQFAGDDAELMVGGTRALNRAMADFCAEDDRLIGVASISWLDVATTVRLTNEAIDAGNGAVMIPSAPPKEMSPTHPDWAPFWRTLEERDVPFLLHIGGDRRGLRRQFHNNGRPVSDFLGGGENIRAKDYMVLHQSPEAFLSSLILDGTFEDHPNLRGGVIELGAMWVVPWLRRLDIAQGTFKRTEPTLQSLPLKASEYVHRQLRFTPFPTEPVGWMIEQCGDDLFLFSSDYPHPEGGRDPLARFEESMAGVPEPAKDRFYSGNFADLLGLSTVLA
ncbi:MAG TPA: amidohydrolase family protein [Acidimicrobiales bacterium]|nr:amidohydrolase family protein [Acidimicrobiales bacterium]